MSGELERSYSSEAPIKRMLNQHGLEFYICLFEKFFLQIENHVFDIGEFFPVTLFFPNPSIAAIAISIVSPFGDVKFYMSKTGREGG